VSLVSMASVGSGLFGSVMTSSSTATLAKSMPRRWSGDASHLQGWV
jgi:hypothetical protein